MVAGNEGGWHQGAAGALNRAGVEGIVPTTMRQCAHDDAAVRRNGPAHVHTGATTTMIYITGGEWDDFGRLVMAVGLVALLAYLAPGMMSLSPQWARRLQIVAIVSLTVAIVLASVATVAWFLR